MSSARRAPGVSIVEVLAVVALVALVATGAAVGVDRFTSAGATPGCPGTRDAVLRAAADHRAATGTDATTFDDLADSGSFRAPEGTRVTADGRELDGPGWTLSIVPGSPPGAVCTRALPVGGAVLWLDAGRASTVELVPRCETTAVWRDLSGNGFDLRSRLGVAGALTRVEQAADGEPAIVTDGRDVLQNAAIAPDDGYTVLVVASVVAGTDAAADGRVLAGVRNDWLLGWWAGREDQAYFGGWVSGGVRPNTGATAVYAAAGRAGSGVGVWRDGTALGLSAVSTEPPMGISVGGGAHAEFSAASVHEVLVYQRALDADELASTERHLAEKWGLPTASTARDAAMAPDPMAWFDASVADSFVTEPEACTTAVGAWHDAGGTGEVLVPAGGGAHAATYEASAIGDRPAVVTTGIDALVDPTFTLRSAATVFVVARPVDTAGGEVFGSAGADRWYLGWSDGRQDEVAFGGWVATGGPAATSDVQLYSAVLQPGTRADVWRDGAPLASSTSATATPIGLALGTDAAAAIGEVIVYPRALTDAERHAVENHLADTWGVPLAI